MDSFTESILSRARERQKLLEGFSAGPQPQSNSEPNLTANEPPSEPKSGSEVSSAENVRVEVQIEEREESAPGASGLRADAKNRLNRLGQLYAGGDDAGISSPIHRTEAKFDEDERGPPPDEERIGKKMGLNRLATLAQNINEWEDDLTQKRKVEERAPGSKKSRAPPPPPASPLKTAPKVVSATGKQPVDAKVKWDKKVLDSLESQGFTRTESTSRLVYNYNESGKENANNELTKSPQKSIAAKAAMFESSPNRQSAKDPALLSVSERKALFERNKGAALVPKAAFGMATPVCRSPIKSRLGKATPAPKAPTEQHIEVRSIVHQAGGIANKVAQLFEGKTTISQEQIESGVKEQRQKEMEMLLNRFHKPQDDNIAKIEEEEEEDEIERIVVDETTKMIDRKQEPKVAPSVGKPRRSGGNKRNKADSPKVVAVLNDVKRIKVMQKEGRLYPSLTDIESQNETENENVETRSPTPNNSSFGAESDDINTSFGRDILQAVCKKSPYKKQRVLNDSTESSDMSSVLDDFDDDYIDEALSYNPGPPPPKQGRHSPIEPSHSFNYKNYQTDEFKSPMKQPPKSVQSVDEPQIIDGNNMLPLTHTVSFYRKQQTQSTSKHTPIRQLSQQQIAEQSEEENELNSAVIETKIRELKFEINKQEMIIAQTSQALNLCNATPEFIGSTEQVEAERVLLLATHRRQAASYELQRIKVENTLRPQIFPTSPLHPPQKATLTLTKIVLPLKQKYVTALAAAGGKGHHVVCLIKHSEHVSPTQLVSTVASNTKNPDLELHIPGTIQLANIYTDFTITFEVYCLQAQEELLSHELKYHIRKGGKIATPKKTPKQDRLARPLRESPAGPQVVRSPTFALMGIALLSIETIGKKQWSLNNCPSMSPLEGTVQMSVNCALDLSIEHRGFLTMFEDVSGFGAWHRRWCLLKGATLSYWKYPDDERKTAPINTIDLRCCVTKEVGVVSREICARLHTFLIEVERMAHACDKDTLVTVRNGDKTIVRHLLSADTKEERLEWCQQFNSALSAINNMWP